MKHTSAYYDRVIAKDGGIELYNTENLPTVHMQEQSVLHSQLGIR